MKSIILFYFYIILQYKKCESVFSKSNSELNIIGGHKSERNSWPWTASIVYSALEARQCGATIISSNWLITAGHCFSEYIDDKDWTIEIGGYGNDDIVERHQIDKVFIHEKFENHNYMFNDIALIRLNSTITSSFESLSLVNHELLLNFLFDRCVIIGWGTNFLNKAKSFNQSKFLQEADVPFVDIYECAKHYKPFEIDPNTQICAGGKGIGTCFGDSGSALQCWHKKIQKWFFMGITSFGRPCAKPNVPDVFTSIAAFNEWIHKTMKANN